MVGLLYKDFVCFRGKIVSIALAVQLVVLTVLRFSFRNDLEADTYILLFYSMLVIGVICYLLFFMDTTLLSMEKKSVEKRYFLSLPISKQQYVAEKYVFLLIAVYAMYSLLMFEGFICQVFCTDTMVVDETGMLTIYGFMVAFQKLLLPILSFIMFIASQDFGFMMCFGVKRGQQVKNAVLMICFFLLMVYLFFGDLSVIEKLNINAMMYYLMEHQDVSMLLTILFPAFCGVSYYVSYLISVRKFMKREDWLDD